MSSQKRPNNRTFWYLISTFFYVGYFPVFPGTVTSFVTAVLIYLVYPILPSPYLEIPLLLLILFLGVKGSHFIEKDLGKRDPQFIVIDEVAGMMFSVLLIPKSLPTLLVGLILFRIFDIWKPWLIDRVQNVPKGWGVMLDDLLAGFAAWIFNCVFFYCVR
ncbi:MAG: phosphatidylglycerophosphatase A [Candidatus Marinimicrobia bacterium]|nr:phosphatidylglycerophosphatase A [Candidatus Neomarinimicrobiota bacterium]